MVTPGGFVSILFLTLSRCLGSFIRHTAESKDTESDRGYQGGSNSSSLRPACLKSASTGGSCLADGLLIAKSVGSARSSTRSTISTAVPGLRPPHLEGASRIITVSTFHRQSLTRSRTYTRTCTVCTREHIPHHPHPEHMQPLVMKLDYLLTFPQAIPTIGLRLLVLIWPSRANRKSCPARTLRPTRVLRSNRSFNLLARISAPISRLHISINYLCPGMRNYDQPRLFGVNESSSMVPWEIVFSRTYPTATAPEYGVDMAGGDAATVCLRNHGASGPLGGSGNAIASAGTAIPSANRLPRFGEQPTNNQVRLGRNDVTPSYVGRAHSRPGRCQRLPPVSRIFS